MLFLASNLFNTHPTSTLELPRSFFDWHPHFRRVPRGAVDSFIFPVKNVVLSTNRIMSLHDQSPLKMRFAKSRFLDASPEPPFVSSCSYLVSKKSCAHKNEMAVDEINYP